MQIFVLCVQNGDIKITDFSWQETSASELWYSSWGEVFIVKDYSVVNIDPMNKILPEYEEIVVTQEQGFILRPGVTVLGTSIETFGSEKYLIQLSGKSSLANVLDSLSIIRQGLSIQGIISILPLELANMNSIPIILRPGMDIAQLLFVRMSSPPGARLS